MCDVNIEPRRVKGRYVPEQELTVQIADVDGVHVDNMDILESGKSQIGQNLAPQSTSANDKDFDPLTKPFLGLEMREVRTVTRGLLKETESLYHRVPILGRYEDQPSLGFGRCGSSVLASRRRWQW